MTEARDSLRFDRAVGYYDRTRALPPEAGRAVTGLLAVELAGRGPTVEIGAGTGRIALPLHDAGIELIGVDLSRAMLEQLIANAGGTAPFPLVCADATSLPLETASVGSAIACHILHLIPDWRAALAEVARVVRPGGRFLCDVGGWGRVFGEPHRSIMRRWADAAEVELRHRGVEDVAEVNDAMAALGWSSRELPVIQSTRRYTLAELLESLASGVWSCTWDVPEGARRAAARRVKPWVEATFGSLDEPRRDPIEIAWQGYEPT